MTHKNVIISEDRLAVVLAYLADKAPEGLAQRREWARCMAILSAQRKEAPQPDDAAGKCGGCELRGNCAEDMIPGGCPRYVAKKWQGYKAAPLLSLCVDCTRRDSCSMGNGTVAGCDMYTPATTQIFTTNATPPNQYDPATVAFPPTATRSELEALGEEVAALSGEIEAHCRESHVTRETHERELNEVIDSLSARMDALVNQVKELDKDHVELVKCYVYHLKEHMPEALRNAGEVPSITREELAGVDELRAEVVALAGEVTAQPGYFDAAIARAIAAHEIATAEHFQGQIDTLSRVVDEDRKAVVAHERELHPDAPCVRLARVIASAPKDEPKTCPTCHHHAVCDKPTAPSTGCESWEGEHPK
jgi:hypothetical protein